MNLILLDPHDVADDGRASISDGRATHAIEVLKVTPGQSLRVGLIDGPRGTGTVTSVDNGAVTLRCVFEAGTPPRPAVDLLLALPRPKVMNRLWAQLAALGVGRIILTNADKVERPYFDTHVLSPEHYRPLLIEGLQQARDTRVPQVSIHRQFRILIEDQLDALCPDACRLVADPGPDGPELHAPAHAPRRILLAVGPEGGWNDFERGLLQAHGFTPIGMGARVLRSDTACIALVALAHHALSSSM